MPFTLLPDPHYPRAPTYPSTPTFTHITPCTLTPSPVTRPPAPSYSIQCPRQWRSVISKPLRASALKTPRLLAVMETPLPQGTASLPAFPSSAAPGQETVDLSFSPSWLIPGQSLSFSKEPLSSRVQAIGLYPWLPWVIPPSHSSKTQLLSASHSFQHYSCYDSG